jgi:hypothetical protein
MRKLAITITGIFALTLATAGCKQETGTPEPVRPVLTTVVEPTLPVSTVTAGSVEPRYTTNNWVPRAGPSHLAPRQRRRLG